MQGRLEPGTHSPSGEDGGNESGSAETALPSPRLTAYQPKGVVIDYLETLGGTISTPRVFQADTTYLVDDPVYCNGPVTIEGGAVFKYWNSTGNEAFPARTTFIQLNNTLSLKTGQYRPAIFTALDDNSVGENHPWSVGVPTQFAYANPAIKAGEWLTLSHCRFSYAKVAVECIGYGNGATATVSHSQFINCVQGFSLINSGCGSGSGSGPSLQVTANNCLLAGVTDLLKCSAESGVSAAYFYLNQCTVADVAKLVATGTQVGTQVIAQNSIFADVDAWGTPGFFTVAGNRNGFHANGATATAFGANQVVSTATPFQPTGAGHYYLRPDSSFRTVGTTNVGTALLNQFKTRTTQPPMELPRFMTISGELTLFPQIPRYASGNPDLGYHYPALDFTVAALFLIGGRIAVQPGAAIAVRNDCELVFNEELQVYQESFTKWGFVLLDGSTFHSQGSPQAPNTFTTVELVQDGRPLAGRPFGKWAWMPCRAELFTIAGNDPEPVLSFRFSNFSVPSQWCYHFISGGNSPQIHSSLVLKEIARYRPFTDWIYSDNLTYSFHSGIPLPPSLAVVSLKRLWSGDLNAAGITAELRKYQPGLIALLNDTRTRPFQDLLDSEYRLVYHDDENRLYAHRSIANRPDQSP